MGALYAAWLIHPREVASELAEEIVNTAAPLTTSLSAAWLNAAARGQAGISWHALFGGLIAGNEAKVQQATKEILATGETSGADALSGFLGVMKSYIASFSRKAATSSDE
jgi:hypothetical protein